MEHNNVLKFERPSNRLASHKAQSTMLDNWRDMFREFKTKHALNTADALLVKNLIATDRANSLEQWTRGLLLIAKYATPTTARRLLNTITTSVLDHCARPAASLQQTARDEFLAGNQADAAQYPVIERHADCSDAQLIAALKAGENQIAVTEVYCASLRAELARRQWVVAI